METQERHRLKTSAHLLIHSCSLPIHDERTTPLGLIGIWGRDEATGQCLGVYECRTLRDAPVCACGYYAIEWITAPESR